MVSDSGVRAFHRSRLFWCGAVVFLFLTWVWWDSGAMATMVTWERGVRECSGWLSDGEAGWETRTHVNGYVGGYGVSGDRYPIRSADGPSRPGFEFPAGFEFGDYKTNEVLMKEWRVGMWVVLVLYAVGWMGVMVWWQRRRARKAQGDVVVSGEG